MNNESTAHFRGVDSVRVLSVVEIKTTIGAGTSFTPADSVLGSRREIAG